jgi:PAS domain S-box-containing protein
MNYWFRSIFEDRKNSFSDFWFKIVRTRLFLAGVVAVFTALKFNAFNREATFISIAIYIALNLILGLCDSNALQLKKVRIIPAIIDVIFASSLVYFTGGPSSPWFLLYFFPIISVSRYLSYEGSVPFALLSITAYFFLVLTYGDPIDSYSLLVKIIVFLGIALITGNLSRARQRKDDILIDFFKEIDDAILRNVKTDDVLKLILEKALEFTSSELGYLEILESPSSITKTISIKKNLTNLEWQMDSFTQRYYKKVIDAQKPFSILNISSKKAKDFQDIGKHLIYVYWAYTESSKNIPRSALFVPLILNNKVKGIITLYSKYRLHYSQSEAIKLGSFAQLVGIALKSSELYQGISDSEKEKKERLKMLYEIGEQLKVEQGLPDIFQKVVDLMYNRLNSEEASLFILSLNEENKDAMRKVAVRSPSEEITTKLLEIEPPYPIGESYIGEIFQTKKLKDSNSVPVEVAYRSTYAATLPSQKVLHYIGVPLIIGEEILGVIRVINKRSPAYSLAQKNVELSEKGFDEEDIELMQTIASQVASAIRSAKFIEVQRYYQEIIENSPDPIIVLDKRGKITFFNQACEKIMERKFEETKGISIVNCYESEAQAREVDKQLMESSTRRVQDFAAKVKAKNGDLIPVILSASLLLDKEGKKIGSIGIFKDLRETLKLQEEKMRAEKLATLGQLAHTVGHEIKHLIATALNYIDTLAYENTDDEELSEVYQDTQESLREAVDKFQNMLMIGKPKPPRIEILSAEDILHKVESSVGQRAKNRQIEFVITYPDNELILEADSDQLKQALLNLFDNSIDAIVAKQRQAPLEKGKIDIKVENSNGDLRILWQDNGCGISEKNLVNIFTPFVTDKPTGNGLGLFIVKSIIENHGGDISVESEEGKGTKFLLTLPLSLKE